MGAYRGSFGRNGPHSTCPDNVRFRELRSSAAEPARDGCHSTAVHTAETGTGLGLSIVQSIAEANGWSVEITESAAGGARIELTGVVPVERNVAV